MEPTTVPLSSKRHERALVAQKIQHVIPAMGLFIVGMQALGDGVRGAELVLAVVQLVTSAGLVVNFIRHVRAVRGSALHRLTAHHGVDWFEIFSAGVLFVEAYERWHLKHRIPRPILLTATVTLAMGLLHGRLSARIARHRVLRVDDHGIRVGGKFWRTFDAPWTDLAEIDLTTKMAVIVTRRGRTRRLQLYDLLHGDEARRALTMARSHLAALQPPPPVDKRARAVLES